MGVLAMELMHRRAVRRAVAAVHRLVKRQRGYAEPPSADQMLELHKDSLPPRLTVG
jgi:hypothetical protein